MNELAKQLGSMVGTTFAGICCLGVGWALAGLFIAPGVVYAGLASMVAASGWDFVAARGRRRKGAVTP